MSRRLLGTWSVLFLVPLVPVLILYAVFEQANFFKLEDAAKGILATGPIAAYVALVWIAWLIYRRISNITMATSPALSKVLGRWSFTTESSHGNVRTGSCTISQRAGMLTLEGDFAEGERSVGAWRSQMAQLTESELCMVYNLSEVRDGVERSSRAVCSLSFDPKTVSPMRGSWVVVGVPDASGTVTYTKV